MNIQMLLPIPGFKTEEISNEDGVKNDINIALKNVLLLAEEAYESNYKQPSADRIIALKSIHIVDRYIESIK